MLFLLVACNNTTPEPWWAERVPGSQTYNSVIKAEFMDDDRMLVLGSAGPDTLPFLSELDVSSRVLTEVGTVQPPNFTLANPTFGTAIELTQLTAWSQCIDMAVRPGTDELWINLYGMITRYDGSPTLESLGEFLHCQESSGNSTGLFAFSPDGGTLFTGSVIGAQSWPVTASGLGEPSAAFGENPSGLPWGACEGQQVGDEHMVFLLCGKGEGGLEHEAWAIREPDGTMKVGAEISIEQDKKNSVMAILPPNIHANGPLAFDGSCMIELDPETGMAELGEDSACTTDNVVMPSMDIPLEAMISPSGETLASIYTDAHGLVLYTQDPPPQADSEVVDTWCWGNGSGQAYALTETELTKSDPNWGGEVTVPYTIKDSDITMEWGGNLDSHENTYTYWIKSVGDTMMISGPSNRGDADDAMEFGTPEVFGSIFGGLVFRSDGGC